MTTDYDHLEAVARAANGRQRYFTEPIPGPRPSATVDTGAMDEDYRKGDGHMALHYATFDPPVVLGLIAAIRRQGAAIQAVREVCGELTDYNREDWEDCPACGVSPGPCPYHQGRIDESSVSPDLGWLRDLIAGWRADGPKDEPGLNVFMGDVEKALDAHLEPGKNGAK